MTAKEHIEKFVPEPYKSAALEGIEKFPLWPDEESSDIVGALNCAFWWNETRQGHAFWEACAEEPDFSKWPELTTN